MMRITVLLIAVALLSATAARGQAPATSPVAPAATTAPAAPKVPPLEPQGYDYDPAGRRDPFISLVRRTTSAAGVSSNARPRGLAGLSIDEITVRGVIRRPQGSLAMVKGVNGKGYTLKVGDELYDGSVRAITADAVFFLQDVNDPLSVAKKREVRKPLRPAREAQ